MSHDGLGKVFSSGEKLKTFFRIHKILDEEVGHLLKLTVLGMHTYSPVKLR